jgi:hypothetical protein
LHEFSSLHYSKETEYSNVHSFESLIINSFIPEIPPEMLTWTPIEFEGLLKLQILIHSWYFLEEYLSSILPYSSFSVVPSQDSIITVVIPSSVSALFVITCMPET